MCKHADSLLSLARIAVESTEETAACVGSMQKLAVAACSNQMLLVCLHVRLQFELASQAET